MFIALTEFRTLVPLSLVANVRDAHRSFVLERRMTFAVAKLSLVYCCCVRDRLSMAAISWALPEVDMA